MNKFVSQPETKQNIHLTLCVSQENSFPLTKPLVQIGNVQDLKSTKAKPQECHHHFGGTLTSFVSGLKCIRFKFILMPELKMQHPYCIYWKFFHCFDNSVRWQDELFKVSLRRGKASVCFMAYTLFLITQQGLLGIKRISEKRQFQQYNLYFCIPSKSNFDFFLIYFVLLQNR